MRLEPLCLRTVADCPARKTLVAVLSGEVAMSARRTRWLCWTRQFLFQSRLPVFRASQSTETRHVFLAVVLALGAALVVNGCAEKAPAAMGPPTVLVVKVIQKDIPLSGDWVATLD